MSEPVVSVVLIGYNDASRITRALDSIRNQTLRSIEIIVVDDASTDATADLVMSTARSDPRIRLIRREMNSGGCSAPRNDGLAVARAPWVMFCDSDDEYERHACATLLAAAQDWDADIVCGMAVRRDVRKAKDKKWRPTLHERDRVVESLDAEPGLLYDTISVNKIYRRSMLIEHDIEFPPELLFEDQVFTLRCYLAARRIGIIQSTVYIWNVDRASEEASITQGRMQRRNVVDRVRINELMDEMLASSSNELRLAKAVKFLRHEGYLYLWAIAENPDAQAAAEIAEIFRAYVRTVEPSAFDGVRPVLRVALFALLVEDLGLLRRAMRWERWASVVDTRIVPDGGRQYWMAPDDRNALGRGSRYWLDVTHLHLLDMPFSTRRYFHELVDINVVRSRVNVDIRTTDFVADLDESTTAHLVWTDKAGAVIASLSLSRRESESDHTVVWAGNGQPTVHIDRPLMKPDRGSLAVRLEKGPFVNTTVLRSVDVPVNSVFIPMSAVAYADRPSGARLFVGERFSIAWRPGGMSRGPVAWGRRLGRAFRRRVSTGGEREAARTQGALLSGRFDVPRDRPIVAYVPAPSQAGRRMWPMDLSAWDEQMADVCYLVACGDIEESVPTRLWGSIRDARDVPLGEALESAALVITDDPALIETVGDSIVFRPDEGAARYLLPELPSGYPVIETTDELCAEVRAALARSQVSP